MKLEQNVGPIDRIARLIAALGLAALAYAGIPGAPAVVVTLSVAAILAATGVAGFCPLYAVLGIRTARARG